MKRRFLEARKRRVEPSLETGRSGGAGSRFSVCPTCGRSVAVPLLAFHLSSSPSCQTPPPLPPIDSVASVPFVPAIPSLPSQSSLKPSCQLPSSPPSPSSSQSSAQACRGNAGAGGRAGAPSALTMGGAEASSCGMGMDEREAILSGLGVAPESCLSAEETTFFGHSSKVQETLISTAPESHNCSAVEGDVVPCRSIKGPETVILPVAPEGLCSLQPSACLFGAGAQSVSMGERGDLCAAGSDVQHPAALAAARCERACSEESSRRAIHGTAREHAGPRGEREGVCGAGMEKGSMREGLWEPRTGDCRTSTRRTDGGAGVLLRGGERRDEGISRATDEHIVSRSHMQAAETEVGSVANFQERGGDDGGSQGATGRFGGGLAEGKRDCGDEGLGRGTLEHDGECGDEDGRQRADDCRVCGDSCHDAAADTHSNRVYGVEHGEEQQEEGVRREVARPSPAATMGGGKVVAPASIFLTPSKVVYLVRHGHTAMQWGAGSLHQSSLQQVQRACAPGFDVPLSSTGMQQALTLHARFCRLASSADMILVSPLTRALQTLCLALTGSKASLAHHAAAAAAAASPGAASSSKTSSGGGYCSSSICSSHHDSSPCPRVSHMAVAGRYVQQRTTAACATPSGATASAAASSHDPCCCGCCGCGRLCSKQCECLASAAAAAAGAPLPVRVSAMHTEHVAGPGDVGCPLEVLREEFPHRWLCFADVSSQWQHGVADAPNDAQRGVFCGRESRGHLRERVGRFRDWLRSSTCARIVVVGHSTFFMELMASKKRMKHCEVAVLRL